MDRDSRYFLLDVNGESTLVDKQTYRQYRVRASAAARTEQAVPSAGVTA